jgi:hypothetical protein
MRKVTGDEDIARFRTKAIADPCGRIVWLQIARGRQFSERVARTPECFRRLLRAQLPAVPHHRRLHSASGCVRGDAIDFRTATLRERAAEIDVRPNSVAMVN